jgi:hypothetical protein
MEVKEQLLILTTLADIGTIEHVSFLETVAVTGTGIRKKTAERIANILRGSSESFSAPNDDVAGNDLKKLMV